MQPDQPTPQTPPPAQPTDVPQPAQNATIVNGMTAPTVQSQGKLGRTALYLSIASLILFLVAFLTGYAAFLGAVAGAFGASIGIRTKHKAPIIIGFIGLGLNLGLYAVVAILSSTS